MSKRTDKVEQMPWVTHLDEPSEDGCIGFKSGTPLKALYRWGAKGKNPPVGLDNYRCKNSARWHFEALEPEDDDDYAAKTGDYCWSHLVHQGLHGTPRETERTRNFFDVMEDR